MNLKFIPVVDSDRDFFIHVHHAAYRTTIEKMFGWDEKVQDDFAIKAFNDGGMNIIWVDNKKVGVVGWDCRPDHLWLKELFILPEYQGQGIGSQIISSTIERAKQHGHPVRLQTLKANTEAQKLYKRHGFVVTSESKTHVQMIKP